MAVLGGADGSACSPCASTHLVKYSSISSYVWYTASYAGSTIGNAAVPENPTFSCPFPTCCGGAHGPLTCHVMCMTLTRLTLDC